jgi:hypothetical protein
MTMLIVPTFDELRNFPTGFDLNEKVRPSVGGIQINMMVSSQYH